MANWLTKKISGLDWWDKKENQQQRDQFAREDEEERRRKAAQAARVSVARNNNQWKGVPYALPKEQDQPNPNDFDFNKPLASAGSQSDFDLLNKPLKTAGITSPILDKPLKPAPPEAPKPKAAPLADQEFVGVSESEGKNKTIFGKDVGQFMGSFGKTYKVNADRKLTTNKDKYVAQFDKMHPDYQKILVNQAREKAKDGDQASINTIKALEETGRLKGDAMDFIEGSNEKLFGGLSRGTLRGVDALLPGKNTWGLEQEADRQDAEKNGLGQFTETGDAGETFGSVQKGIVDVATIVLPQSKIDKLAEGTKVYKALKDGSKIMQIGGKMVKVVPGSLTGTGIDYLQQIGRGDDPELDKALATGVGFDLAVEAASGPLGKGFNKIRKALKGTDKQFDGLVDDVVEEGVGGSTGVLAKFAGLEDDAIDLVPPPKPRPPRKPTLLEPIDDINIEPLETLEEIKMPGARKAESEGVDVGGGFKSTNTTPAPVQPKVNIPSPANPIALATATDNVPTTVANPQGAVDDVPMADFSNAVQAPLKTATVPDAPLETVVGPQQVQPNQADLAEQAAAGELRQATKTEADALGNEALVSDTQAAQDMIDEGIAPLRQASPLAATEEGLETAAERAAADEVALTGAAAPRTRARITSRIDDAELRADLNADVPALERQSLPEAEASAKQFINDLSDDQLIGRFADDVKISDPQGFYAGLNAIKRLEAFDDVPEAQTAIRNALDAMTEYASASGRGLRTTQIVFEDMPTTMKADYLINKISKAGVEMDDVSRAELLRRIQASDAAADGVRALEGEADELLNSGLINNRSMSPEVSARAAQLSKAINDADRAKELAQGDAWRFYQDSLPNSTIGKRIGDMGRTLMLSSPTGRVFDVLSTTATTVDDTLTRGVSNALGKVVNKFAGPGAVTDTIASPFDFGRGMVEGAKDIGSSFKGRGRVESILDEAQRNTRGDIQTGGGRIRNAIRTLVETPTNLTRGIQNEDLFRQGMQEAKQQGLKGGAAQTYARLRAAVPTEDQFRAAEQSWRKANMLHDNAVSRALNNVANSLDKKGGGWASPLIRNQIAPFTSWLGGNLHRTITDKNVLWNVGSALNNARKGNLQGVIDDVAKFGVNSAEAMALGYGLTQAGVITTQDANGDSYGGLYFHVGDRYIPVAIAGTASVPLILGNAVSQGMEDGDLGTVINEAGMNTLKNAGVASVFGGDNNFQSAVAEATREGGDLLDATAQYFGGAFRQYIPGITADVNAIIDQTGANPTGEAAATRVTETNPDTGREVTNTLQTEINKTMNRVPGLSQMLDREEGKPAKDLLDRSLKATRETGEMAEERNVKESLEDMEKRLKGAKVPLKDDDIADAIDDGDFESAIKGLEYKLAKTQADPDATNRQKKNVEDELLQAKLQSEGVPVTEDGIKARTEDGDYESAMLGYRYQLHKLEGDKNVPDSKREGLRDEITRLEITANGSYPKEVISLYSDTSQSEWRAMGNPESEDYDPELYEMLWDYDEQLTKAGVSKSSKGKEKQKFAAAKGRGGSGGGKSGKGLPKGYSFDIATQSFRGGGFDPQRPLKADFATPESAIPVLATVPNYDQSKKKKITVSKGGRS